MLVLYRKAWKTRIKLWLGPNTKEHLINSEEKGLTDPQDNSPIDPPENNPTDLEYFAKDKKKKRDGQHFGTLN